MSEEFESNPRKTGLIIGLGFTVIFFISWQYWALIVGLTIPVLCLISPWLGQKIEQLWFGIAKVLGYIVPNIVFTLVFFFILFPIALFSKLFGKRDPLKLDNKHETMYISVNKRFDKASLEKPF